jgi:DNA-binding HxlR family transcriptional regulator
MYERKIPPNLTCGLDLIAEVLYGKWKIRMLYFIHEGHQRPSELQRKIPDATRRVLNMQLNELERHGLVYKVVYAEIPLRVEYKLTEIGKSLIPLISNLGQWADEHEDHLREVIMKR